MARGGIDRKVMRAAPLMILAANIPDIDTVSFFAGPVKYLQWHRGYTHSFAFAPGMALIAPLAMWAIFRQRITLWGYFFSLLGVMSHLLLDWTNVYGIRLLLPFSSRWLRLDQTDIVDPWIWGVLLIAVAAPALARMVSTEIGAKSRGPRRGWAWFALIALFAYEGVRLVAHDRALAEMNAHIFNGTIPSRVSALPVRENPWLWRGIAEAPGFVDIVPLDLAQPFDADQGRIDYDAQPSPAIAAAKATHPFQVFASFDQLPFWKATPLTEGTLVELIDLRFGTPQDPGFEARALVDRSGEVTESLVTFGVPLKQPR